MKHIDIIPLALKKIELRKIPVEWIKETLNLPEQTVDGYSGRKVRQRKYNQEGREMLLRVIVDEEKDKFIVITAYLTSQVSRYWR
ncbi:MAG: DUF4258 domain-containing protein [Candidatus Omnitrophica bacterium]|nr:DUF4258 domain-containing protein [Candidatus Omnitrophota bacterium]